MFAAKHFDPQLGIDAHTYLAPPGIWPTVHIGIVMDPSDYLPTIQVSPDNPIVKGLGAVDKVMQSGLDLIGESTAAPEVPPPPGAPAGEGEMPETIPLPLGATIEVGGVRRANAGTGGVDFHILVGAPMPIIKGPMGPQFEDELFMGSRIVLGDGEPFARITMPVLSCNVVGLVPPFRKKKMVKPVRLSLMLPTTFNVAIPPQVFIGGPPTISWATMIQSSFMKGLGKAYKAAARKIFAKMPSGFLKCTVLRAEPVDIRDGSVSVTHEDFSIPGRLPLTWTREYASTDLHSGVCGHGWQTPADMRLEIDPAGHVTMVDSGRIAFFERLPVAEGEAHMVRDIFEGARLSYRQLDGERKLCVRVKDGVRHFFELPPSSNAAGRLPAAANDAPLQLRIERIEDLCGNHWQFLRSPEGLMRIAESGINGLAGRSIEVRSRDGRIEAMALRDPATGQLHPLVQYRYDKGDLVAALDALGAARTFEYVEHRMLRHTDRTGLSFYYAYDTQWRVVHAWGDGGLYDYDFEYDEALRETRLRNSLDAQWIVKFDENDLPLAEVDPLNGVTTFEYDEAGRTVAVTDPEGLRTDFGYDERGNVLSIRRPDGSTTRSEYDDDDQLIATIDPLGHRWAQASDERSLPVSQTDPLGAVTRFDHDAYGQLLRHVNARGAVTKLQYDRHGQLNTLTDPLGYVNRFEYDVLGRLLEQADALGQTTHYRYDAKGRLLSALQPGGSQITCDYDPEDQLVRYVDEAGAQTRLKYVGIGQIGKRIQPDGHTVQYHYDTEEQLIALTNQRGERYELRRDALGRIVEEVDYWGQSRHYQYDGAGRLISTVDPLSQRISFATDKLGRVTRKTFADVLEPGRQVQEHFRYDLRGQLMEMRNDHAIVKRRFDPVGRLLEELQNGFKVASQYDEVGNRVLRETTAGNRVGYVFDLRNQVASIAVNGDAPIVMTRDALGRTTRELLSPQMQRRFEYDARSLLTAQTVLTDARPAFDTRYDYDRAGNLTYRYDSEQGVDEFRYDVLGRLLQHTDPKSRIERFFNDPAGDRLRTRVKEVQAKKVAGAEGDLGDLQWTREGAYDGMNYVFDRAGDLIRKGEPTESGKNALELVWDANHRLVMSVRGGQVTMYGYDPMGRRTFKRNPMQRISFWWDEDILLAEASSEINKNLGVPKQWKDTLSNLNIKAREYVYYPNSFVPLALMEKESMTERKDDAHSSPIEDRGTMYYHVDPNGFPLRITDKEATNLWTAEHSAWGVTCAAKIQKIQNNLRHQGQYSDQETGLFYNRYRYYDAHSGQYVGPDPIGLLGGENTYQYCKSPANWIDPLGLASHSPGEYNVFFEARLPSREVYRASDPDHFSEANRQLYYAMKNDPTLKSTLEARYPGIFNHVSPLTRGKNKGGFRTTSFSNVTWHHHPVVGGLLQLVDQADHGSRHGDYHPKGPDGKRAGGRFRWGGGTKCRR